MLGSMIAPRTALQENMMVVCSRMCFVIGSIDIFLTCFRVIREMEVGHSVHCQNLSSGQYASYAMIQASPGTLQSQSVWMTCMICFSRSKSMGNATILVRKLISSRVDFVMLNFSFEFHTVLSIFGK